MTLHERLTAVEQEREKVFQIQQRALNAANESSAALLRLEGQMVLLKELIAEAGT